MFQFRALSWQLYGTQSRHDLVRQDIVKWMKKRENEEMFQVYFDGQEQFQAYINQVNIRMCGMCFHALKRAFLQLFSYGEES